MLPGTQNSSAPADTGEKKIGSIQETTNVPLQQKVIGESYQSEITYLEQIQRVRVEASHVPTTDDQDCQMTRKSLIREWFK